MTANIADPVLVQVGWKSIEVSQFDGTVWVELDDDARREYVYVELAPEQARRLAAALTEMADQIDSPKPFRVEDVMDPNFTDGMEPTEFLDKLHSGQLKTTST